MLVSLVPMDLGSYLRSQREERRLTIEAVASTTKIKPQLLIDLEANNITRWPKDEIYRRGFLRSYARAIGLDPEELLEEFRIEFEEPEPPEAALLPEQATPAPVADRPKQGPRFHLPRLPRLGRLGKSAAIAIGLVACAAVFALLDRSRSTTTTAASEEPGAAVKPVGNRQPTTSDSTTPDVAPAVASSPAETYALELQPLIPSAVEGTLVVVSDPPGAFVTVNGIGRGRAPVKIQYLAPGSYSVRIVQDGYRAVEQSVVLDPVKPFRTVKIELKATSQSAAE